MKTESLSLRRRTKISPKLPSEFETKVTEFQRFVIGLRRRNKWSLSQIGNADETAIFFDMPRSFTVNFKGEKQVAMKTTGYEKLRVTVLLCITANGNKLPPYVILNRKSVSKENFCKDVTDQAPQKCMDDIGVALDVYGNVGLVRYQSHGVCLQWIHFVAISPTESEIG
jgi:hypothetical protein